jgi:hypothetical protein
MPSVDDLQAKLRAVLEPRSEVLVAYLFGSVARGTSGPLSDVDVAVLLSDDVDGRSAQLMARWRRYRLQRGTSCAELRPRRSGAASSATGSSSQRDERAIATGRHGVYVSPRNRSVDAQRGTHHGSRRPK